jgi:hypothetical protein
VTLKNAFKDRKAKEGQDKKKFPKASPTCAEKVGQGFLFCKKNPRFQNVSTVLKVGAQCLNVYG